MTRLIDLPARRSLPPVSIAVRISTPGNKAAQEIDRALPTILLSHPIWSDSFFFYPQYEDPEFNEHFNLVTIEPRGHGETVLSSHSHCDFAWSDAADDAALVLKELGAKTVHVVGVSIGSQIGLHLAHRYPLTSLTLVNFLSTAELPEWTAAFHETKQLLIHAIRHNDVEALDDLTLAYWDLGLGRPVYGSIKELRDRFVVFQRTRLHDGQLGLAVPYICQLLATRLTVAKPPPKRTLVQFLTSNQIQPPESLVQRRGVKVVPIGDVDRWATLTNPQTVNPLILDHIAEASLRSSSPSPLFLSTSASHASLSSAKSFSSASSPTEMVGFDIPPPPIASPGVLTIGQVLDKEKFQGIPVTVEVHVSISPPVPNGQSLQGQTLGGQ